MYGVFTYICVPSVQKHFRGRNLILNLVIVTMLFGGGMIPSYLVYCAYGLYDSYWALILPALISPFNMIIIKNFFQDLPQELEDAAYIDGCSDIGTFVKIVLPLSKPVIASISLFYGVGFWNDYFSSMIYLKSAEVSNTDSVEIYHPFDFTDFRGCYGLLRYERSTA